MVSLSIRNLSVELTRQPVLHDVSADLTGGQLVGIVGPNGAGKSTLVRALLGLIDRTAGSIVLDGQPVDKMAARERARRIAYLPQQESVHWPVTVERLVLTGRLPYLAPLSRPGERDRAAVMRALDRVGIAAFRHRAVNELSGGELARVMLARALAVEADLLVTDEPLASLDPAHQFDVMALLREEAASGCLVLAILHDLNHALRECDRLLLLHKGKLCGDGCPADVLSPARMADVYGIRTGSLQHQGQSFLMMTGRSDG